MNKVINIIVSVFLWCMLNVIFLEYIIRLDNGAGPLVTFCQFVFIASHGLIFTSKFGKAKNKIPPNEHIKLNIFFFINSVISNWTYAFNIPLPLNMIFRSGSLIANMILGIIIQHKRYTVEKYASVFMVTLGIIICTLYTGKTKEICTDCQINSQSITTISDKYSYWFFIGILLSLGTLFLSASIGLFQEHLYKKYGKQDQEALYYTHLYPLPGFILYSSNITEHAIIASKSDIIKIPSTNFGLPQIWIFIFLNALTQYLCISSVYKLSAECQSLTVTLVLTLRKLFSLLFSVMYFQNPFTTAHWFGCTLVFIGTLIFSETHYKFKQILCKKSSKCKEE